MMIEKIKNFNQVILAIAGVLSIIILIVIALGEFTTIFWSSGSRNDVTVTNSLLSDEQMEILNQEKLRSQIISYESPKLIDTLNSVYIIPISVATLNKPEMLAESDENHELSGLLDTHRSMKMMVTYPDNYFDGLFANLVVYKPLQNKSVLLFNERIMLCGVSSYHFEDDILLVFFTAEKDTNKDGLINLKDDKNLCVYSLKTEKMRRITDGANSITNYQFIGESKDLLIEFELSQYGEVKFKSHKPHKVMKYEFTSEKISEVVPDHIQKQMQNLVQGKMD